jgi:hypothetical protein
MVLICEIKSSLSVGKYLFFGYTPTNRLLSGISNNRDFFYVWFFFSRTSVIPCAKPHCWQDSAHYGVFGILHTSLVLLGWVFIHFTILLIEPEVISAFYQIYTSLNTNHIPVPQAKNWSWTKYQDQAGMNFLKIKQHWDQAGVFTSHTRPTLV